MGTAADEAVAARGRTGGHRRNVSEPASSFSSPLSAAAIHSMNSHPFWTAMRHGDAPFVATDSHSTSTPTAAPAAAAPADAETEEGSPTSPRSVTASPTPSRGGSAKQSGKSGGLRATASRWWERRSSKDAKSEREALKVRLVTLMT